jgi:hypothetical protein
MVNDIKLYFWFRLLPDQLRWSNGRTICTHQRYHLTCLLSLDYGIISRIDPAAIQSGKDVKM